MVMHSAIQLVLVCHTYWRVGASLDIDFIFRSSKNMAMNLNKPKDNIYFTQLLQDKKN